MQPINLKKSQQGSALLTALFIMTLVAIVATAMSARLQLDIYRTQQAITYDKLYLASQFVTFWAMNELRQQNDPFQHLHQKHKSIHFPSNLQNNYPDIKIKGELYDLQSLFNLNNLQNKAFQPQFSYLLEHVKPNPTITERQSIAAAITYWLNPYHHERGRDHQIDFYLKQRPSYLPSYQLMQSTSELRLIKGITPQLYTALLPYITVLPEITPINLNTAPKEVLMTLGNGLTEAEIDKLLSARGKNAFKNIHTITPLLEELQVSPDKVTLESTYFMCVAETSTTDLKYRTYTLLKRKKDKHQLSSIGIIRENINTNE